MHAFHYLGLTVWAVYPRRFRYPILPRADTFGAYRSGVSSATGPFHAPPARERPDSPPESYGVPQTGGDWIDWQHVVDRLITASAYWLATVTPSGRPHVVPVWGCLVKGRLFLETGDMGTIKNRNIAGNREVQVHLDGVEDTVIVRGRGEPFVPTGDVAAALARAMHDKYHALESLYDPSPDSWNEGGLIEVVPRTVLAWKDMPTATRWRFDRR
jgi:hypothetical protein